MDFWAWGTPLFRILLYFSTFGSVGIVLFNFHFVRYQSLSTSNYCANLLQKSAVMGIVASVGSLLSIAGSMGGNVTSALKIEFLELVFEMKSGWALMLALVGFFILVVFNKNATQIKGVMGLIGSLMILSSFTVYGHSTTAGFVSLQERRSHPRRRPSPAALLRDPDAAALKTSAVRPTAALSFTSAPASRSHRTSSRSPPSSRP